MCLQLKNKQEHNLVEKFGRNAVQYLRNQENLQEHWCACKLGNLEIKV